MKETTGSSRSCATWVTRTTCASSLRGSPAARDGSAPGRRTATTPCSTLSWRKKGPRPRTRRENTASRWPTSDSTACGSSSKTTSTPRARGSRRRGRASRWNSRRPRTASRVLPDRQDRRLQELLLRTQERWSPQVPVRARRHEKDQAPTGAAEGERLLLLRRGLGCQGVERLTRRRTSAGTPQSITG